MDIVKEPIYFVLTDKIGRSERFMIIRKSTGSVYFTAVAMASSLMAAKILCDQLNRGCHEEVSK